MEWGGCQQGVRTVFVRKDVTGFGLSVYAKRLVLDDGVSTVPLTRF